MSKILQRGETGFGILIEQDSGYIDDQLNKSLLTEGKLTLDPNQPILINCVLQKWGTENKNGRIYPKEILVPQVEAYQKLIDMNSAVSEADHPDCMWVEKDSQILTKNGWKEWENISENEEIQTLNTKTNKIEIQKIDKKIYEDYNGEMFEFKSRTIDITVTPNHRFLLEDNKGVRFYMTAQEIYEDVGGILSSGKNKILKKSEWIGETLSEFVLNGVEDEYLGYSIRKDLKYKYTQNISINAEDWFAFLGIYLADGHCLGVKSNKRTYYDICITQKKENTKKKIKELLDRLPFEYRVQNFNDGKEQYHIHDARLYKYLFPLGNSHNKYIPYEIKQASSDLLKTFFDWFRLGDGRSLNTINKTKRNSVFSTSKQLIDDLHEVLIKIGGSGNITTYQPIDRVIIDKKERVLEDGTVEIFENEKKILSKNSKIQYNLHISNTSYIWLDKRSIKINKIHINDKIACVRVPNGNFMTRVNGKAHWTGNSSVVSLHNLSHIIRKMWWGNGANENILYGQLELITSPAYMERGEPFMIGDKIAEYLKRGIRLGISSRGVGSIEEVNGKNIVQNDFELISFDLVSSPSTPGAYLFPERNELQISTESTIKKNILEVENKIGKLQKGIDILLG
jgi:hypothetical protein